MLAQKNKDFQHSEANCVCSSCLCGRCRCKAATVQGTYAKNMMSTYQNHFIEQQGSRQNPYLLLQSPYKGSPGIVSKTSMYRENYKAFTITAQSPSQKKPDNRTIFHNNSPFNGSTQYNRDFSTYGNTKASPIKPFDQISHTALLDFPSMMETVYRSEFKKHPQMDNSPPDNDRYKLHTNAGQRSPYMTTTYQQEYPKKEQQPLKRNGVQKSNFPLGMGPNGNFRTIYQDNFTLQEIRKCPAREILEVKAEQSLKATLK